MSSPHSYNGFGFLAIGNTHFSGAPSVGIVSNVEAIGDSVASASFSWVYEGDDEDSNIFFLVYLNGRLVQRLPGSARESSLLLPSLGVTHSIEVIPWRRDIVIEGDYYGGLQTLRGHLEWTRPSDSGVAGYLIESSSDLVGPYEEYSFNSVLSIESGFFSMGANSTLEVSGSSPSSLTNALYTVEVVPGQMVKITNDNNADEVTMSFISEVPFVPLGGLSLTIHGDAVVGDSASFICGVQPWFDTDPLSGTTWFRVVSVDEAGNKSSPSTSVPITVSGVTPPCENVSLAWAWPTGGPGWEVFLSGNMPNINGHVVVYSNHGEGVLLPSVNMEVPYATISPIAPGAPFELDIETPPPPASGTLKVVVRAVSASGVDDGTFVIHEVPVPREPDEAPAPHSLTATPTAGGGVSLKWLTDRPWVDSSGDPLHWSISGHSGGPDVVAIPAVDEGFYQSYTYVIDGADITPEGQHTLVVTPFDPLLGAMGPSVSVTVVTDSTPPAGVTDITGIPF